MTKEQIAVSLTVAEARTALRYLKNDLSECDYAPWGGGADNSLVWAVRKLTMAIWKYEEDEEKGECEGKEESEFYKK